MYSVVKGHTNHGGHNHIKEYIADRGTPPSGMTLAGGCTSAESKIVACWLQAGALDN